MRRSLYISERLDKDLLEVIEQFPEGDFSLCVKNLMRDGIKYRQQGENTDKFANSPAPQPVTPRRKSTKKDFLDLDLQRSSLSDEEIANKLDNL